MTNTIKSVDPFADRAQALLTTACIHPGWTWMFTFPSSYASSINDILLNLFLLVEVGAASKASN